MKTVTDFAKNHLKALIAVLVVIVAVFGAYQIFKPANVLDSVTPTYSGTNGNGVFHYDEEKLGKHLGEVIMKDNGLSKDDIEAILGGDIPDDVDSASAMKKVTKSIKEMKDINVTLDKKYDLSNGDKVTMTLKAPSDSPIKSCTKTFKVTGLSN